MMRRARSAAPWAALAVAALLLYAPLTFSDGILARGDTYAYFYPYWHARDQALLAGRLPLWTPNLFMGVPLLANSQIGALYPLNWLTLGLPPPDAVRVSILLHAVWAAWGAYALVRRMFNVGALAALTAGLIYAYGGYLTAHAEQINQFQGLAWLPWILWAFLAVLDQRRWALPLGMALALQFFTGHTQTTFLTAAALGLMALVHFVVLHRPRGLIALMLGGAAALILGLPQLLPTLELTAQSNRGGGLTADQATAFSFSPFAFGRGLLPTYDVSIFGEYTAYAGVIGLGLALIGAAAALRRPRRWESLAVLLLTAAGLCLAFGLYNPLYYALAGLPPLNLFRVPARWLTLFALGTALLAALGVESAARVRLSRRIALTAGGILLLIAVASALAGQSPDGTPNSLPTPITLVGWALGMAGLGTALVLLRRGGAWARFSVGLIALELILAARALPVSDLTAPEAFYSGRFTAYQLQVLVDGQMPPARFLSISNLAFDPGDHAALTPRYESLGLSPTAIRAALVAAKLQEVIAPNLGLIWGLPTIDGFDGGVLPTARYTAFSSLLMPEENEPTVDGRLREWLAQPESCRGACIPDLRWLNLTGTRYLITDKVFDLWHEGVAYDTQFGAQLDGSQSASVSVAPAFTATHIHILYTCVDDACSSPAVEFETTGGARIPLPALPAEANVDIYALARLPLETPRQIAALTLHADLPLEVRAVTLVDTRTTANDDEPVFQQTTFEPWRRILSSDIKLYENTAVFPRALVYPHTAARYFSNDAAGDAALLETLRDPAFDPAQTVLLSGNPPPQAERNGENAAGTAIVTSYTDERVTVQVNAPDGGILMLADAYYPGWTAAVNGTPTPIWRADSLFRAVLVPPGESAVMFEYRPAWLWALPFGGGMWLIAAAALAWIALPALKRSTSRSRSRGPR